MKTITRVQDVDRQIERMREMQRISDDEARKVLASFRYKSRIPIPNDPFTDEYRAAQLEIYQELSGIEDYCPQRNEVHDLDLEAFYGTPYPYTTGSCRTVGEYLMGVGYIIKTMDLPPGSRILEYGVGWGHTAFSLAMMGFDVTAVDINDGYLELLRRRAQAQAQDITTHCGCFGEVPPGAEPYDAVLFYESFHHCLQHQELVERLSALTTERGKVLLAGETIHEDYPHAWGVRLDGHSVWAIRENG